jgi:putative transposase
MDGRGRFLDNIFIERLWRSLKYECIYLHAFSGGREARQGIGDLMIFYNHRRPHAAHGGETPVKVYRGRLSAYGPGLRSGLTPGPPPDSLGGVTSVRSTPTGRPRL